MPDQQTTWFFKFLQTQEQEPPAPAKLKGDAPGSFSVTFLVGIIDDHRPVFRGLRSEGKNGKMRLTHSSKVLGCFWCGCFLVEAFCWSKVWKSKSTVQKPWVSLFHAVSSQAHSQEKRVFLLLSQKQSVRRRLRQSKTMRSAISLRLVVSITKEWIPDEVCWFLATRRSGV